MDLIPGVAHATATIIVGYPFDTVKCVSSRPTHRGRELTQRARVPQDQVADRHVPESAAVSARDGSRGGVRSAVFTPSKKSLYLAAHLRVI